MSQRLWLILVVALAACQRPPPTPAVPAWQADQAERIARHIAANDAFTVSCRVLDGTRQVLGWLHLSHVGHGLGAASLQTDPEITKPPTVLVRRPPQIASAKRLDFGWICAVDYSWFPDSRILAFDHDGIEGVADFFRGNGWIRLPPRESDENGLWLMLEIWSVETSWFGDEPPDVMTEWQTWVLHGGSPP